MEQFPDTQTPGPKPIEWPGCFNLNLPIGFWQLKQPIVRNNLLPKV
jgi:hypothetical protein